MMTFNEMKEKWNAMPFYANAFLLLDGSHPIEFNIGYEELHQKTLLIMNFGEIKEIPSSKAIIARNYQYPDGSWVLSFRLVKIDNEEVFLRFCWDIIESSREDYRNKYQFIIDRYNRWLRLMEHKRPDIMDLALQKGLLGELLYLLELTENIGIDKAVRSWAGPDGADQDFIYDDTWAEIKTISPSAERISISSLEQLDNNEGSLVVYFIEKTTPDNSKSFSLDEIVNNARLLVNNNIITGEILELKLFQYGYKDLEDYKIEKYFLCKKQEYYITIFFPRLIRENVNSAIVKAKYEISLAAIECFLK